MATTTGGTTYVTSTDLVADYPTASLALANRVDIVASGSMSKKTASYTVTVADILAGTTIAMNSASATVITLPSTSLVNGMIVKVFSVNTGAVTFTGGTVTGSTTSITAQYSGLTLTYDSAAAVWWCLPFSSGVSAANFTNAATGTFTGFKYLTFTGNGSLVIDRAGFMDMLVIGGGGGEGSGGGGAGGANYVANLYVPVGTFSVVVGGGGAVRGNGNSSYALSIYGIGGGNGGDAINVASVGGSGGGTNTAPAMAGIPGQGNAGALFANYGGGGGSGAAGSGTTGGAGSLPMAWLPSTNATMAAGWKTATSNGTLIAGGGGGATGSGASTPGAGGGAGRNPTGDNGVANTGGGAGGSWIGGNSATGGSGIVIVRVAV